MGRAIALRYDFGHYFIPLRLSFLVRGMLQIKALTITVSKCLTFINIRLQLGEQTRAGAGNRFFPFLF